MDTLYKIKCSGNSTASGIRNMKGKKPHDGVILPLVYTWRNPLQPWSESTYMNENCNGGGAMVQVKNYVPL